MIIRNSILRHAERHTLALANCPKGLGGRDQKRFRPSSFLRIAGVSLAQRNCAGSCLGDDLRFGCERAPETGAETGSSTAKTPIFLAHSFSSFGRFLLFLFTVFA